MKSRRFRLLKSSTLSFLGSFNPTAAQIVPNTTLPANSRVLQQGKTSIISRIALAIALALSFLMMFGSMAMAEEIKVPIPGSTSEPTKLEIVKVPPAETNKPDSPPPQAKASDRILEAGKQTSVGAAQQCSFMCSNNRPGNFKDGFCEPC